MDIPAMLKQFVDQAKADGEAYAKGEKPWPADGPRHTPELIALTQLFELFPPFDFKCTPEGVAAFRGMLAMTASLMEPPCAHRFRPALEVDEAVGHGMPSFWIEAIGVDVSPLAPLIVYIHGGAYIGGDGRSYAGPASSLSRQTGFRVLAFNYRLQPEHPLPAAVDDVEGLFKYLTKTVGIAPERIAFVGDSAGGGLSLLSTQRLLKSGQRPGAVACLSPFADYSVELQLARKQRDSVFKEIEHFATFLDALPAGTNLKDPIISPVYGSFKGFPPLYVSAAQGEMLAVDSERVVRRAQEDSVSATLDLLPGDIHVGAAFNFPEGREAMTRIAAFVKQQLTKP